jgi:hypothetical protein
MEGNDIMYRWGEILKYDGQRCIFVSHYGNKDSYVVIEGDNEVILVHTKELRK